MIAFASFEGFAGCVTSARQRRRARWDGARARPGEPAPACDLLVLSSWHESYEPLLDVAPPVVARWHSPLLQTELSDDGWKLERLLELRVPAGSPRAIASTTATRLRHSAGCTARRARRAPVA